MCNWRQTSPIIPNFSFWMRWSPSPICDKTNLPHLCSLKVGSLTLKFYIYGYNIDVYDMELIINHNCGNNIFDILQKFESLTQSEKKMSPYSSNCWKLVPSLKYSKSGIFQLFAATYRNWNWANWTIYLYKC